MADQLTAKQELFARHYVDTLNGTEAARLAGYKGGENSWAVSSSRLLRTAKVKTYIAILFRDRVITPEELLTRVALMAIGQIPTRVVHREGGKNPGIETSYDTAKAADTLARVFGMFKEELILSWKEEAKEKGIPASQIFEEMVNAITEKVMNGSDPGSQTPTRS
jgi:hypothetical protein